MVANAIHGMDLNMSLRIKFREFKSIKKIPQLSLKPQVLEDMYHHKIVLKGRRNMLDD